MISRRSFLKAIGLGSAMILPIKSDVDLPTVRSYSINNTPGWITVGPQNSGADYICDGINDEVQVQAAIDAAYNNWNFIDLRNAQDQIYLQYWGYQTAYLMRGGYNIKNTLDLKERVHLELDTGAIINTAANIDAININKCSSINGGTLINCYDTASIKLSGTNEIQGSNPNQFILPSISNMMFKGSSEIGTAIHLLSNEHTKMGYIYGFIARNIIVSMMKYGVRLESEIINYDNWIRDNIFSNIYMWGTQHVIDITTTNPGAVSGNVFENIHVQCGPTTDTGVRCGGTNNAFNNIQLSDFAGSFGCDFTAGAEDNRIDGNFSSVNRGHPSNKVKNYSIASWENSSNYANWGYQKCGIATIPSNYLAAQVTHGLGITPEAKDITVTPINNMGNATKFWVDSFNQHDFIIHVDVLPGPSTAIFSWRIDVM